VAWPSLCCHPYCCCRTLNSSRFEFLHNGYKCTQTMGWASGRTSWHQGVLPAWASGHTRTRAIGKILYFGRCMLCVAEREREREGGINGRSARTEKMLASWPSLVRARARTRLKLNALWISRAHQICPQR
jgi:hypothetical protein